MRRPDDRLFSSPLGRHDYNSFGVALVYCCWISWATLRLSERTVALMRVKSSGVTTCPIASGLSRLSRIIRVAMSSVKSGSSAERRASRSRISRAHSPRAFPSRRAAREQDAVLLLCDPRLRYARLARNGFVNGKDGRRVSVRELVSTCSYRLQEPYATEYARYAVAYGRPVSSCIRAAYTSAYACRTLHATLEGWSVNILPVRSTAVPLPRNEMEDQALFAWDTGAATGAGRGFGEAGGQASAAGTFRIRNVEATFRASGVFRKSWKSRSLLKT